MRLFLLFTCLFASLLARPAAAQTLANGELRVDCPTPEGLNRCVDFDASRSVDAAAGPQTYIWHLGDSTTLTGPKVSHCYARLANYRVVLDVRFDNTGELRPAERTFNVNLAEQGVLDFKVSSSSVHVGEPVQLDAISTGAPNCDNVPLLWDFRDGRQDTGRHITHTFTKPGTFQVLLYVQSDVKNPCFRAHCVSRLVEVSH